jgi:hypothetical protein
VDRFYQESDPERENLCLYGLPTGDWHVDLPAEEVPPELPGEADVICGCFLACLAGGGLPTVCGVLLQSQR